MSSLAQQEVKNYKQLLRLSELHTPNDVNLLLCLVRRFIGFDLFIGFDQCIPHKKLKLFKDMDYYEVGYYEQIRALLIRYSDDEAVDFVEKSIQEKITIEPAQHKQISHFHISAPPINPKAVRNFEFFFSQLELQDPFYVGHRRSMSSLGEKLRGLNARRNCLIGYAKMIHFSDPEILITRVERRYESFVTLFLRVYDLDQKIKIIEDKSGKILLLISKKKQEAEKQRLAEERREKAEEQQRKSKASKAVTPSKPAVLEKSPPPPAEEAIPVGAPEATEPLEEHPLECAIETIRAVAARAQAPLPVRRTEPQPPARREHELVRTILGKDSIKSVRFMSKLASFLSTQPLPGSLTPAEAKEARQIMNRGGSKRLASLYGPAGELSLCYFHEPHGRDDDIHPKDFMWKNVRSSLEATGYLSAED